MFENFSYNQLEARLKECKTHLPIFQSWLDFTLDLYRDGIADENNVKTSISLVSHCERSIAVIETRMNPYHDELGRFTTKENATCLTKKKKSSKISLSKKEKANFYRNVNTWYYHRYSEKVGEVCSYDSGFYNRRYYFMNYGYDNYEITDVRRLKQ